MEQVRYKMQYLEEMYEKLTPLGSKEKDDLGTYLVKNKQTGKIAVEKYIDTAVLPVYQKMEQIDSRHLEKVYHCASGCSFKQVAQNEMALVITEYISGMSLHEHMEKKGYMDEAEVCGIIRQLLEVLQTIHAEGIVHRDINPDNIIISGDGVLKLIDFGIAREKKVGKNQDTTILGTVGYAAPEQFGFLQTDERADIYAVGVLMNKMLTGYFPGEKLYSKEPMRGVIAKCTAMDLRQRYMSANELSIALASVERTVKQEWVFEYTPSLTVKKEKKFTVDWLPGFRTGVVWKNIIATVGYCMMILYTVGSIAECMVTWQTAVLEVLALFLYIWLATLLSVNIANWDRRVPICRDLPRPVMIVIRVFLWITLFYVGMLLENHVRYDMLGIPRP